MDVTLEIHHAVATLRAIRIWALKRRDPLIIINKSKVETTHVSIGSIVIEYTADMHKIYSVYESSSFQISHAMVSMRTTVGTSWNTPAAEPRFAVDDFCWGFDRRRQDSVPACSISQDENNVSY